MNVTRPLLNMLAVWREAVYYIFGNLRAGLHGVRVGAGARISPYAKLTGVYSIGCVTIGRDVTLGKGSYVSSGQVMAARIGEPEKAFAYYMFTAQMDLDNKQRNTDDGIHAFTEVTRGRALRRAGQIAAVALARSHLPSMICASIACASCHSVRAASPTTLSSRICG